ncbi:MAG: tungsten ABC transporter substrate-binding protein [Gammaproteobacteria bacterium]|nr:tungsten ABC transporter substrate-binding protein [Gammaproteobacteria bacterium]
MSHKKQSLLLFLIITLSCAWASIGFAATDSKTLRMATTTSTENSGLLRYLLPYFTKDTGYEVHVIAVGTGKALRMGQDGDVDVVLVHAPPAEAKFVAAGYGDKRYPVMYNDFVILGPKDDPAKVGEAKSLNDAMKRIASTHAIFVSRGDDSGTNKKEIRLWKAADIKPHGAWYREAGQGMGKVIQMTDELNAYTLSDRGTWIAFRAKTNLKIVYQHDKGLYNPYGVIAVSQKRYPDINHKAAQTFIDWIISDRGQKLISEYKIAGQQLFTPDAQKVTSNGVK